MSFFFNEAKAATTSSCEYGYRIGNNQVYFCNGEMETVVTGIDISSFQKIDQLYYAKDNNAVYCNGQKIGADPVTFQLITKPGLINYYKDAVSVYFGCGKLEGSDPETFENIKGSFNRDKNNVYFQGILLNADRNTFTVLGNGYAKDNTKVFFTHYEIVGADAKSFEVKALKDYSTWCGSADARDKNAYYLQTQKVCPRAEQASPPRVKKTTTTETASTPVTSEAENNDSITKPIETSTDQQFPYTTVGIGLGTFLLGAFASWVLMRKRL